jgi:hypothetical protein
VSIVSEVIPATWDSPAQIVTIEGNNNNRVCNGIYELGNPAIIGYGLLPDGPAAVYSCGKTAHTHGSECNDETGASICPIPVHSHNEQCRTKQLQFTDGSVSVDISLTNAVYVPENLELRAELIQKETSSYESTVAILEKALQEENYSLQDAVFCRLELTADGKPYQLPCGVQAQVQIAFPSPVLMSEEQETETQLYTHMLETKKTTGQIFDVNYEGRDGGITALYFSAYRLSEATVALATVADCK